MADPLLKQWAVGSWQCVEMQTADCQLQTFVVSFLRKRKSTNSLPAYRI